MQHQKAKKTSKYILTPGNRNGKFIHFNFVLYWIINLLQSRDQQGTHLSRFQFLLLANFLSVHFQFPFSICSSYWKFVIFKIYFSLFMSPAGYFAFPSLLLCSFCSVLTAICCLLGLVTAGHSACVPVAIWSFNL